MFYSSDTSKGFYISGKKLNVQIICEQEKPNDVKLSQQYCHRDTFSYAYIGMILSWIYFVGNLVGLPYFLVTTCANEPEVNLKVNPELNPENGHGSEPKVI